MNFNFHTEAHSYDQLEANVIRAFKLDLKHTNAFEFEKHVMPGPEAVLPDVEFEPFPKIARLNRDIVVTEKIDGSNAQVIVTDDGRVFAASRTRLIYPGKTTDNHGFAGWVQDNADELVKLGPGRHFGEWWGSGIQRGYGLKEKRFSLFNVSRWSDAADRPACCGVVPTLYRGVFDQAFINGTLATLGALGSTAAPGFMDPEGVVVFHEASRQLYKVTIKDDEKPKSLQ